MISKVMISKNCSRFLHIDLLISMLEFDVYGLLWISRADLILMNLCLFPFVAHDFKEFVWISMYFSIASDWPQL